MAITHLSGTGNLTSNQAVSGTSLSASSPTNAAIGDLIIGFVGGQATGGGSSITVVPTGWTAIQDWSGTRPGGIWYYPITDATALTNLQATPAWTASASGRWGVVIWRATGVNLTSPIDVVGAVKRAFTDGTNTAIAYNSVTSTLAHSSLVAVVETHRSDSTGPTTITPTGYTDLKLLEVGTASGNRSTMECGFTNDMGAAGSSSGSCSVAVSPASVAIGGATLFALAALPEQDAAVSLAVGVGLSVVVPGAKTATVPLTVNVGVGVALATPVQAWLASSPYYCAHRGGDVDWPEETLYAYSQAAAWSPRLALEVSVWQSSDGVWVCSHDRTTARVFGTSYDIPTTPWSTLQTLRTTVGNQPIAKLVDVLNAYATGNRVLFIDNKNNQSIAAFYVLLDSYGGGARFVIKGFQTDTSMATEAHARGYLTWGYYYEADVPSLPSTQASWDLLGMDYTASTAAWSSVLSYSKPVLGHIIPDAAGKTTALGKGATGLMVSGVVEAVPQVGAGSTVPLVIGVTLAVSPLRTGNAVVPFTVSTILAVQGQGGTILVRDITVRPGPVVTRYAAGPATT